MIKIEINFYTGDTFITSGSCQLFIDGYSDRCRHTSYQTLVGHEPGPRGETWEYTETLETASAFAELRGHITIFGAQGFGRTAGVLDSVTSIALDRVSKTQDIIRRSILV